MLRTIIAAVIGGLATFVFLLIWDATQGSTDVTAYFWAGVVGAIGTLVWPAIVGIWFMRRAKNRRDEKIQQEVDRQISQKS
jgi:uncharacterized membrane protein